MGELYSTIDVPVNGDEEKAIKQLIVNVGKMIVQEVGFHEIMVNNVPVLRCCVSLIVDCEEETNV